MQWPVVTITDWDQLERAARALTPASPLQTAYLFRGQSSASWPLSTSLARCLPTDCTVERALRIETALMRDFRSQAHLHVPASVLQMTNQPVDWWSLMQHHGAPTRLLDWTESPYVAAYFACSSDWNDDGAIWLVHGRDALGSPDSQAFKDLYCQLLPRLQQPDAPHQLLIHLPAVKSERMLAQQGAFTLGANVLCDHEAAISDACSVAHHESGEEVYRKIVIPADLKRDVLRHLKRLNVTASSLFPGIDGLGRSLAELARLAAWAD